MKKGKWSLLARKRRNHQLSLKSKDHSIVPLKDTNSTVSTKSLGNVSDSTSLKGLEMIRLDNGVLKINNSIAINLKEISYIDLDLNDPAYFTVSLINKELVQFVVMIDMELYPEFETEYDQIELEWNKLTAIGT